MTKEIDFDSATLDELKLVCPIWCTSAKARAHYACERFIESVKAARGRGPDKVPAEGGGSDQPGGAGGQRVNSGT